MSSNIASHSHSHLTTAPSARSTRLRGPLTALLLAVGAASPLSACSKSAPQASAPKTRTSGQQLIVERSAAAFERLQNDPRHAAMASYLQRARGVMIFPRLVKASLIFGGEGGNGVLVAKKTDGTWSAPAFYSIGAPSVGLQLGYQQTTVVLFVMDQPTLERALGSSFSLGTKAGVSVGNLDDVGTNGSLVAKDIYQVIDAEGVFAGASLDGYVIGARERHNREYYGKPVSPREILVDASVQQPGALVLQRALETRSHSDLEKLEASKR